MAKMIRMGLATASVLACFLAPAPVAAWTIMDSHAPRLGYFTDTAPVPSGLNYVAPRGAYRARYAPWTPEWLSYCSSRYVSFNPQTGYYVTYSGRQRFCR